MGLLSSIGQVVGIASSVADIAGGLKKPKGPGDALKAQVRAGAKVGLHPLASIGGNFGYSDPASVLGEIARGGSQIADRLEDLERSRKAEAGDKEDRSRLRALAEAQIALTEAEIAEARSRTLLNQANAKRVLVGPRLLDNGTHGGMEMQDRTAREGKALDGRKVKMDPVRDAPLHTQSTTPGGDTYYLPNPDLFEVGINEIIGGGLWLLPQWLQKQLSRKLSPKEYKRQQQLRRMEPPSP